MKSSFSDWLLSSIENLQNIDFGVFFMCIVAYIVLMWVIATFWVYFDARRRYKNIWIVILIALLVAPFNFPALILYIMLRPEYTRDDLANIEESIANLFISQGRLLTAPENKVETPEEVKEEIEEEVHILQENVLDPESRRLLNLRDAASSYILSSKSFIEKTRSQIVNSASKFAKKNQYHDDTNKAIDVVSREVELENVSEKKEDAKIPKRAARNSKPKEVKKKTPPAKKTESKRQLRKTPPVKLVLK